MLADSLAPTQGARWRAGRKLSDGLPASPRWPQLDIFEPTRAAVVLQADVTAARMVFVSDVKFVRRSVRTLVRFSELVEVCARDGFTVQDHFDAIADASDLGVVPFSDGLH